MRWRITAVAALTCVAVVAASPPSVQGHRGDQHYEKQLFTPRWYQNVIGGNYVAWITLQTSDGYFECDGGAVACRSKWGAPVDQAIADWNAQPTTAYFQRQAGNSLWDDVSIHVVDVIPWAQGAKGGARVREADHSVCLLYAFQPDECSEGRYWYAEIWVGDDAVTGAFSAASYRKALLLHELGHALGLRHEGVLELGQRPCYEGVTGGEIPATIMQYDCIDPVTIGGEGLATVAPWDVCGVNHAYPDPAFGNAGCTGGVACPLGGPNTDAEPLVSNPLTGNLDYSIPNDDDNPNHCDADDDNDGWYDELEARGCNGSPGLRLNPDSDGDRYRDLFECVMGSNPGNSSSTPTPPLFDADGDGLSDSFEIAIGSNPYSADSNGDGIKDGLAVYGYSVHPSLHDSDGDGCSDRSEIISLDNVDGANLGDIGVVIGTWGRTDSPHSDIDKNGKVGLPDLGMVTGSWGIGC
jgi:hypothetical protein